MKSKQQLCAAPFLDISGESLSDAKDRILNIGKNALYEWYTDFGKLCFPESYGQTPCEFAASVGYMVTHNGPSESQIKLAKEGDYPFISEAIKAYKELVK